MNEGVLSIEFPLGFSDMNPWNAFAQKYLTVEHQTTKGETNLYSSGKFCSNDCFTCEQRPLEYIILPFACFPK